MPCIPCFSIVETSEIVAVERCGRLSRFGKDGCVCFFWPWETTKEKQSFRQDFVEVTMKTKTKDDVFITVQVACNYQINSERIYQAYYELEDRKRQMAAYIKDGIRTAICTMTLDAAYAGKDEVSSQLKQSLLEVFTVYGLNILNVLVREITPDNRVLAAMNHINASKRELEATEQRAEGEKTIKIKRAEAEADSMYLSGVGVANQRKAIMDGLKESIVDFSEEVSDTTPKEVMDLLILNQYFDTLEQVGQRPGVKVVMLPADNNAVRQSMLEAAQATQNTPLLQG